jgi:hypothetical protein
MTQKEGISESNVFVVVWRSEEEPAMHVPRGRSLVTSVRAGTRVVDVSEGAKLDPLCT